ncbi:unnamed protein product [Phytophthora lilii]|uniref:Unnamed protein product n=1 Tax=Phytophthora lilii TaxID=2077276 RepID=A0A9W6WMB4_9STRA|nr:unnamed protein product [Phytophthora lilii]
MFADNEKCTAYTVDDPSKTLTSATAGHTGSDTRVSSADSATAMTCFKQDAFHRCLNTNDNSSLPSHFKIRRVKDSDNEAPLFNRRGAKICVRG